MRSDSLFRALAIDIDGTLINSSKRIPEFTRSEIHRVIEEYGVHVFLVTARGPGSADMIGRQLGVSTSVASFGGALVTEGSGGSEVLRSTTLGATVVTKILEAADDADVYVGVHTIDNCFVNRLDYWALREARNTGQWPQEAADGFPNGGIYKIMFRGESDALDEIARRLESVESEAYVHQSGRVVEIVAATAVKLSAVEILARRFGFGVERVVAFGDTAADVEMLEGAGVGVLMGNADPRIAVDDEVLRTLSNDEDGVGIALRRLFGTSRPFVP